MTLRVPYIADDAIERDAEALLGEFAHARGIEVRPPIPIEDIVEKHLKLRVEFDNLHERLGVPRSGIGLDPDIFGAIWLESGQIVIDECLDPDERPEREGRYRFTLAHEGGGHWRLHRPLVRPTRDQGSLLIDAARPTVVCRSSQAKERVEWQADFYASCLLMPRKMVFAAWDEAFPDRKQRVLQPSEPIDHPFVEIARFESRIPGAAFTESDDQALERFARPFADKFLVSPIAMRIRLEKLGLLHRVVPRQRLLTEGFCPLFLGDRRVSTEQAIWPDEARRAAFETRDFYLACFLRCAGYELLDLRAEGRRKVFVFQDRPTRRDDVMAFYGDAAVVRPQAFAATIKDMKGLLHNG